MPLSWSPRINTRCVCILILLIAVLCVMIPLDIEAGYDIAIDGDQPGGDGQPDDIGNAPRPGILQSVVRVLVSLTHWVSSLFGQGGLFS